MPAEMSTPTWPTRRRLVALIGTVLLVLASAACGSDDSAEAERPTTTSRPSAGSEPTCEDGTFEGRHLILCTAGDASDQGLVVALHGRGSSAQEMQTVTRLDRAAADLEVHDGQADRNPQAAVEDFVQETVARVVVVLAVAAEAELLVEIRIEGRQEDRGRRPFVTLEASRGRFSHAFETEQVRSGIERRVFDAGDRQRRRHQSFARLVERAQQVFADARKTCLER